jgi:anti-sigma factor RsiW
MNAEAKSGACLEYEAKLEDYLGGQLSGADARDLAGHLQRCEPCSAALEDARASVRLLQLAEAAPDPGPAFPRVVMARIRTELETGREARGLWQLFISLAWRFAATATLALVVMVTVEVAQHQRQTEPNVASVHSAEVRDLFTTEAERVPSTRDDVLLMVAETEHGSR